MIHPDYDCLDLFCRVNVQADMSHREFVAFIARCTGGATHANVVRSPALDISVDENDVFDPEKSRVGEDRWLHFRYTLAIDPAEGASSKDYVAAVAALLATLWASGLDAVASCDFEHHLPTNDRRAKWVSA
jgi:hypothetical protein